MTSWLFIPNDTGLKIAKKYNSIYDKQMTLMQIFNFDWSRSTHTMWGLSTFIRNNTAMVQLFKSGIKIKNLSRGHDEDREKHTRDEKGYEFF